MESIKLGPGLLDQWRGEFERSLNHSETADNFCQRSVVLVRKGHVDFGCRALDFAIAVANRISELPLKKSCFERIVRVVKTMPDQKWKRLAFDGLAPIFMKIGAIDQAVSLQGELLLLALMVKSLAGRVLALYRISSSLVGLNKEDRAREVLEQAALFASDISDRDLKQISFYLIAKGFIQAKASIRALPYLERALELAVSKTNDWARVSALCQIAICFEEVGERNRADFVMKEAEKATDQIPEDRRMFSLIEIQTTSKEIQQIRTDRLRGLLSRSGVRAS